MDANILCTLLAQRIDTTHFYLSGIEVHWKKDDYDTPESKAIVADVIANYETLAAAYKAEQAVKGEEAKIKASLVEIDLKSIRSLREWVVKQPDAPEFIKGHETAAIAERAKLLK